MRNLIFITLLALLASCSTRAIIPGAIANGQQIKIKVESKGGALSSFYDVLIQKAGEDYELTHQEANISVTYKLPSNKLELLKQMEFWLKDLRYITEAKYYLMTITAGNKTSTYKINTDIMHDFITGLKKK
jgi:hypothetical protein